MNEGFSESGVFKYSFAGVLSIGKGCSDGMPSEFNYSILPSILVARRELLSE